MPHWTDRLPAGASVDEIEWARTQPDASTAWRECKRGDSLLWLLSMRVRRATPEHRALVAACCECARLALPYVQHGELRPLHAIEVAERYARGEAISYNEMREVTWAAIRAANAAGVDHAAANAARAAASAIYSVDAVYAAYTDDVYATACAAAYAVYAAGAAWFAAKAVAADIVKVVDYARTANAYAVANAATLAKCADIVRKHRPESPLSELTLQKVR
jgi:hypothetical protein